MFSHYSCAVEGITHGNPRMFIQDLWYLLGIAVAGGSEDESTELPLRINARMKLKPIVPALMVFAEISNVLAYLVTISSMTLADREHRGIHQTERCVSLEELLQEREASGKQSMAMIHKRTVPGETGELMGVVPLHRGIQFLNGFLM